MNESSKANEQVDKESAQAPSGEPSTDNLEPNTSSPDYAIAEPELGVAKISDDVAESVDLKAAEAEAARVEHEAELAAQGLATGLGPRTQAPDFQSSPFQTPEGPEAPEAEAEVEAETETGAGAEAEAEAPEAMPGGAVEDPEQPSPSASPSPPLGASTDGGHGWRRPETSWQQSATPWQPKANPWQSPAQRARSEADAALSAAPEGGVSDSTHDSSDGGTPGSPDAPPVTSYPAGTQAPNTVNGNNKKKLFILLGIVLLGLALIVLFVSLLIGLFSFGSQSADATAVESAVSVAGQSTRASLKSAATDPDAVRMPALSPLKWFEGDCLRDFQDASAPADVVRCNSSHNAQLVGTFYYADSENFPGDDALKTKATEVCQGVEFTSEASGIETLKQSTAYPSESSWNEKDDRRVDCMVWDTRDGNLLESSLIQ